MISPTIVTTVAELRRALGDLRREGPDAVAMVPTMGALHEGHLALAAAAKAHTPHVVVSIFVNPTQFAPNEDFNSYPRTLDADREKLAALDVPLIFAPFAREIYPDGYATTVSVKGPSAGLETDFRPHFFDGVATVVAKLLIAASPDWAIFGEKDYQQLQVVRRLVRDLALPVEIVGHPILREADGLAMSSRNVFLTPPQRAIAGQLNGILKEVIARLRRGAGVVETLAYGEHAILQAGFDAVDYVTLRDAESLKPVAALENPARLLVTARLGKIRLLDNMPA